MSAPGVRIVVAVWLALAGCSSKSEPAAREKPMATPPTREKTREAPRAAVAPHGCPPSAYRNGGDEIRPVLEAVFPDCPPAEFDEALVCVGRACERPCKVTTVSSVNGEASTSTLEVTLDAAGRTDYRKRDGTLESFRYDAEGRLASWEPSGRPRYLITRNETGSITKITADSRTWTFVYDVDGRVSKLVYDGLEMTLAYDAVGREVHEQDGPHASTFEYDDAGRLVHRGTEWNDTLSYDAKGRLVKIASGEVVRAEAFAYDELGRVLTQHSTRETGQAQSVRQYDYCR
jgi:YD repeat-containing protein